MSGVDAVSRLRASLAAQGVVADAAWVRSALEFARAERPRASAADADLEVYWQWLTCDVRAAARNSAALPRDVAAWKTGTLAGPLALQIETIESIGDTASGKNRCLKLMLTDGARDRRETLLKIQ